MNAPRSGPAGVALAVALAVVLAALPARAQTPPLAPVAPVGAPSEPAAPSPAAARSSPVPPPAPAPSPTPAAAPPQPQPPKDDYPTRVTIAFIAFGLSVGFMTSSFLFDTRVQIKEGTARALLLQAEPAGDTTGSACTGGTVSVGTCAQIKAAFQARDTAVGLRNMSISLMVATQAVIPIMAFLPAIRTRLAGTQVGIGPGGMALGSSF